MFGRAICLLITCLFVPTPPTSRAQDVQFFDSGGVQIHYSDHGKGQPVVLVHGFTGSYARHFESTGLMSALTNAGYRVIAFDCRGHGETSVEGDVISRVMGGSVIRRWRDRDRIRTRRTAPATDRIIAARRSSRTGVAACHRRPPGRRYHPAMLATLPGRREGHSAR